MAQQVNQISNGGIANISGLKVYMTVTVGDDEFLIPIVAEDDRHDNVHKILRRSINEVIAED